MTSLMEFMTYQFKLYEKTSKSEFWSICEKVFETQTNPE